jgi:xanthosine utilization system XapX-like protein
MVAVPAWVWRFGPVVGGVIAGLAVAVVVALLALISSNSPLAGVAALVVIWVSYSVIMARRMSRFWPGARTLSGADRVAVARAARSGRDIGERRLAPAVIEYSRGLRDAREHVLLARWLIVLLALVALGTAIADSIFSPPGEAVVSWLYFAFFPVELVGWPRLAARLIANAERAEGWARQALGSPRDG